MEPLNVETLTQRLIDNEYGPKHAPAMAADLLGIDAMFLPALQRWWDDGTLVDIEQSGYSLVQLVTDFNMKAPGAIKTLDWLKREPEAATETLERGYDKVTRRNKPVD